MTVPLLDLKAQYAPLREEMRSAVDRVMDSQYFILGPEVKALEDEMTAYTGAGRAIGVSSGTDALLVALMELGVGPGDEVICPTFTFFATGGVISRLGATPVFVDIDPGTLNLDVTQVSDALSDRTKAVIPVHLFGRMADMDALAAALGERDIPLIEDAAQAIGATDEQGRMAGSVGLMGCYSFFPSKNLGGFGDGGMVVTSDATVADHLVRLRVHGSEPKYYHSEVGGNFRLDALQAAVLRVKLPHLDGWAAGRRANAERYRQLFADADLRGAVILPEDVPGHIYNQFVIRVPHRDELRAFLQERDVGTEVYYPVPLHMQECFRELGYGPGSLPHAEKAADEVLALPIYPELTDAQLEAVVAGIGAFYAA